MDFDDRASLRCEAAGGFDPDQGRCARPAEPPGAAPPRAAGRCLARATRAAAGHRNGYRKMRAMNLPHIAVVDDEADITQL
ncbi:MAG TPA: hypothetical protein VIM34_05440, partial [Burkholderiaceae bacterium]